MFVSRRCRSNTPGQFSAGYGSCLSGGRPQCESRPGCDPGWRPWEPEHPRCRRRSRHPAGRPRHRRKRGRSKPGRSKPGRSSRGSHGNAEHADHGSHRTDRRGNVGRDNHGKLHGKRNRHHRRRQHGSRGSHGRRRPSSPRRPAGRDPPPRRRSRCQTPMHDSFRTPPITGTVPVRESHAAVRLYSPIWDGGQTGERFNLELACLLGPCSPKPDRFYRLHKLRKIAGFRMPKLALPIPLSSGNWIKYSY